MIYYISKIFNIKGGSLMLQHSGKVFFRVSTIDREEGRNPKVYLDIFERDSQRLIGQMRFNSDPIY